MRAESLQGLEGEDSPLPKWEACQRVKKHGQMTGALTVLLSGHVEGSKMWYWMCSEPDQSP